jgi:hypothetical protein
VHVHNTHLVSYPQLVSLYLAFYAFT